MAAQANFIQGGLLLAVRVHYSVCDTLALHLIVNTWSQNTAAASGSSKSFTTYDAGWNDRGPLMEGMPGANLTDFPEYTPRHSTDVSTEQIPAMDLEMPPFAARIFRFSLESLARLKAAAAAFSTNDALSAFIWQRMTLARTCSGILAADPSNGEETSSLAYAVNIRNRMSPPLLLTYLGNASMASITEQLTISTLTSNTALSQAAAVLRKSMDCFSIPSRVPLAIGLLSLRPDPTDLKFAYNAIFGPDIFITSWSGLDVYRSDWGALGTVDALRIPGEVEDGIVIILPRLKDGGLEVGIGLRPEAMEKLLEDEEFAKVAQR